MSRQIWGFVVLTSHCQPGAHINPQGLDKALYVASLLLFSPGGSPWQAPSPALGQLQKQGLPWGRRGTNHRTRDGGWQMLGGVTALSCSWGSTAFVPWKSWQYSSKVCGLEEQPAFLGLSMLNSSRWVSQQ